MKTISITYLSSQTKVADRVFIGIVADSGGLAIDGIDVMLTIGSRLKVVNYIPMSILPVRLAFKNNTFSQLCNPGNPQVVKGLIAVIECMPLVPGTADIKFKFTLGSTVDTNMAKDGKDILEKVTNGRITIS